MNDFTIKAISAKAKNVAIKSSLKEMETDVTENEELEKSQDCILEQIL